MMVVEVKVYTTAPEKYNHSRKLPYPDFSAIIQTAFLYNQPCQIATNPNTHLGVFIKINSKQGRLTVKLQESQLHFYFKKIVYWKAKQQHSQVGNIQVLYADSPTGTVPQLQ